MTPWFWIKIGFLGLVVYLIIGSIAVLIRAYISAISGGHWFSQGSRWSQGEILPGVLLFLWPFIIPGYLLFGIVRGWILAMEYVGDKIITAGQNQEKKLRGGVVR